MPERWGTLDLETGEQQGMPFPLEVRQALELGPGGSLAGASEPEIQAAALAANPMRRLLDIECVGCGHAWVAPAAARCPKCGNGNLQILDERVSMAQRLK